MISYRVVAMGLVINTAIGYGLPVGDFLQGNRIPIRGGRLADELARFIPGTENIDWDGRVVTGKNGLSDLFAPVGDNGEIDHILMFPTVTTKATYYRCGDPIDAAFAKVDNRHTGKTVYLDRPIGHYFSGNRTPRSPIIPEVMQWWLVRFGIFDRTTIDAIRPMMSMWWT